MPKISVLPSHIADLIAAGEVVERPGSVIKELVENSIDAGATSLTVEIKNGGMTFMRVTDNGCGMSPDDAETAFLRHATSKLHDEQGLEAIGTLGFRGEALAAIASISRIELLTKEAGSDEGIRLFLEGGEPVDKSPAGCPSGTTIIVRDLFFNTPARLKFMKNDRTEGANITATVLRCALSHPEVSIRYIKDGKEEYHTPGDGNLESCVYSLFGRDFALGLIKTRSEFDNVTVSGYVSAPINARGNRSYQFFFVNGRFIKSKTLQAALEQAYKNVLFTGKFPACVLHIEVSPAAVDVNVHPAKTEVKFLYDRQVFDGVYYAALAALGEKTKKAEIDISPSTRTAVSQRYVPSPAPSSPAGNAKHSAAPNSGFFKTMSSEKFRSDYSGTLLRAGSADRKPSTLKNDIFISKESGLQKPTIQTRIDLPASSVSSSYIPVMSEKKDEVKTVISKPEQSSAITDEPEAPAYRIIGEALNTYIIVEKGESLFLIDKHAAHERVLFDKLKNEKSSIMTQLLLSPIVCSFSTEDRIFIMDQAELLSSFGFEIEEFGNDKILIRQVPSDIDTGDAQSILETLCEKLRNTNYTPESVHDNILHSVACKAAIKAGKRTDILELKVLAEKVMNGEVQYCPHGRPVAMELSKSTIDKNFKRI